MKSQKRINFITFKNRHDVNAYSYFILKAGLKYTQFQFAEAYSCGGVLQAFFFFFFFFLFLNWRHWGH